MRWRLEGSRLGGGLQDLLRQGVVEGYHRSRLSLLRRRGGQEDELLRHLRRNVDFGRRIWLLSGWIIYNHLCNVRHFCVLHFFDTAQQLPATEVSIYYD